MKKVVLLLVALFEMSITGYAQEIEKTDKYITGYINGTYVNKFKTIDGVLYAVGYEGTKDWILVRYPAGNHNTAYTVHPNCRRIARGAFEGAACLQEIYLPETVSFIGEDAFAGCLSLQNIFYGESTPSFVRSIKDETSDNDDDPMEVARYDLSGRPCRSSDKGIQVVVYSNYTTKTIIVE